MIAIILDRPADSTKISRLFDVGRVVFLIRGDLSALVV